MKTGNLGRGRGTARNLNISAHGREVRGALVMALGGYAAGDELQRARAVRDVAGARLAPLLPDRPRAALARRRRLRVGVPARGRRGERARLFGAAGPG